MPAPRHYDFITVNDKAPPLSAIVLTSLKKVGAGRLGRTLFEKASDAVDPFLRAYDTYLTRRDSLLNGASDTRMAELLAQRVPQRRVEMLESQTRWRQQRAPLLESLSAGAAPSSDALQALKELSALAASGEACANVLALASAARELHAVAGRPKLRAALVAMPMVGLFFDALHGRPPSEIERQARESITTSAAHRVDGSDGCLGPMTALLVKGRASRPGGSCAVKAWVHGSVRASRREPSQCGRES